MKSVDSLTDFQSVCLGNSPYEIPISTSQLSLESLTSPCADVDCEHSVILKAILNCTIITKCAHANFIKTPYMSQQLVLTPIQWIPDNSKCGYCKGNKADPFAFEGIKKPAKECYSHMIGTTVLFGSCQHYDEMMNTGFRRSGNFFYRNDLLRGCCRLYTIRSSMKYLKLDKHHRKTINRFIKEILPEEPQKKHKNQEKFDILSLVAAEQKSTRFYTKFEKAQYSKEKFLLYKKYQVAVHNDKEDDLEKESFERFLCTDPFSAEEKNGTPKQWDQLNNWVKNWKRGDDSYDISHKRIGPTHECYYLDGKLIAFAVLDMLPSGVSSIYFVWDPDYAHLSLGGLAGLREILMCDLLKLGHYYLGFYAMDAAKLKYKANYGGELLDPCNGVYVPLTKIQEFIANGRFFTLGNDDTKEIELRFGKSKDFEDSPFYGKEITNIAPKLFGTVFDPAENSVFTEAIKYKLLIKEKFDVDLEDCESPLPDVMPGLMPMFQLFELLNSKVINKNTSMAFCMVRQNSLVLDPYAPRSFLEAENYDKAYFLNCVRVLGLPMVKSLVTYST